MALQAPELVLDAHVAFVESTELYWPVVDDPQPVVDLLEADEPSFRGAQHIEPVISHESPCDAGADDGMATATEP